jgi:hypothetical protein
VHFEIIKRYGYQLTMSRVATRFIQPSLACTI